MTKTILLVDDEPDLLKITQLRLTKAGYDVLIADSAEKALRIVEKTAPDLIVLDLLLPNMKGEALCKKLKEDNRFQHIPIIVFTAKTIQVPEDIKNMMADDCIFKPFESEELLSKIKKHLHKDASL